jgi:hypothetical protein
MKPNQYLLSLTRNAGLTIVDVRVTGSSHVKARLQRPDGREANFFFAGTPSDKRGFNNKLAELRRFASGEYNPISRRDQ